MFSREMRIRTTMGLLCGVLILIGGLSVGLSLWTVHAQRDDALIINLTSRLRTLVQQLAKESLSRQIAGHDPRHIDRSHTIAHQIHTSLQALQNGGPVPYAGKAVAICRVPDPAFREALEEVQVEWERLDRSVHAAPDGGSGGASSFPGEGDPVRIREELIKKIDGAVRIYQAGAESRVERMKWIQLTFLLVGFFVVALGYRHIAVRVLGPVALLEEAVGRIERGDLDRPVRLEARNEMGRFARNFDEMRLRVRAGVHEQATLLRLSRRLLELTGSQEVMDLAVREAAFALGVEYSAITLIDEGGETHSGRALFGWSPDILRQTERIPLSTHNGLSYAIRTRSPVIVPDESRENRFEAPPFVREMGIVSSLLVPILAEDRPIGGMVVNSRTPRQFGDDEAHLLTLIANQTAIAIERAEKGEELRGAEERYRSLFHGVPVGLYRSTPEGRILEANDAMVRMLGYPDREAFLAIDTSELYEDPSVRPRWQAMMAERGIVRDFSMKARRCDGKTFWVTEAARAIRDDQGLVLWYEGVWEDIDERKVAEDKLRESEERYRDLFESASDLIQVVRADGRILYSNRAWFEKLGYGREEVLDLSIWDIISPRARTDCEEVFRRVAGGEEVGLVEAEFMTKDGRIIEVEGNISCRFENGKPSFCRGIFRDVTERKKVDRMKDEFIATVSHELRTPLTAIRASIDLIKRGSAGEFPPHTMKLIDMAERNSKRLITLIEDLLTIQRIESGEAVMSKEPLQVASCLAQTIDAFRKGNGDTVMNLEVNDELRDIEVRADQDGLAQVMGNLLSNAIKFSPPGSQVEVALRRRNGKIRVSVTDHGPGIPEEFRGQIFQKFTQADSSMTREKGGTGLGLAICKMVIHQMGGEIGYETESGEGTTFYFELPEWTESERS